MERSRSESMICFGFLIFRKVSFLIAAAHCNRWVALEECRAQKVGKYLEGEEYIDRCDLMLWRDSRHHIIDAKHVRFPMWARSTSRIHRAHMKALADSECSTSSGYRSEKMVAVTYIVPVIKPMQFNAMKEEEISSRLREVVAEVRSQHNPTFMSYAFPGPVALHGSPNLGLGVILIGKIT